MHPKLRVIIQRALSHNALNGPFDGRIRSLVNKETWWIRGGSIPGPQQKLKSFILIELVKTFDHSKTRVCWSPIDAD